MTELLLLIFSEEANLSENSHSPVLGTRKVTGTLTPTAVHPASSSGANADPWPVQSDEDIDRLVAMHQNRHNSLSSLGVGLINVNQNRHK